MRTYVKAFLITSSLTAKVTLKMCNHKVKQQNAMLPFPVSKVASFDGMFSVAQSLKEEEFQLYATTPCIHWTNQHIPVSYTHLTLPTIYSV